MDPSNITELASGQDGSLGLLLAIISYAEPIIAVMNFINLSLNCVNIAVFLRMRLSDIMTLGLFFLSVSDCFSASIGFITTSCSWLGRTASGPVVRRYLDLDNFWVYLLTLTMISYNFANNVTSFVAIERCLFVAMPLKVKTLITMRRSWIIIGLFFVVAVAINIPLFTSSRITIAFNPVYNRTRLEIIWSRNRLEVLRDLQIAQQLVIGPISVVTVCVTSYVMIRALKRSAKFRSTLKAGGNDVSKTGDTQKGSSQNLSDNNIRLVKMLLILSMSTAGIHVCSIFFAIGSTLSPEFSALGSLALQYACLIYAFQLLYAANQTVNTFLYFYFNTKFRTEAKKMFAPCMRCCGCQTAEVLT